MNKYENTSETNYNKQNSNAEKNESMNNHVTYSNSHIFTITMFVFLIAIFALFVSACSAPPENLANAQIATDAVQNQQTASTSSNTNTLTQDIELSSEQKNVEFEGFGVGKSHIGTFERHDVKLKKSGTDVVGIDVTIYADSVKTDSAGLDKHLKNADFFNVEKYPTIRFISNQIGQTTMVGDLTFLGVTKTITIPVNNTEIFATNFLLDTSLFGMSYKGVNKDVRIAFTLNK